VVRDRVTGREDEGGTLPYPPWTQRGDAWVTGGPAGVKGKDRSCKDVSGESPTTCSHLVGNGAYFNKLGH
jgi:hypothetical protein